MMFRRRGCVPNEQEGRENLEAIAVLKRTNELVYDAEAIAWNDQTRSMVLDLPGNTPLFLMKKT